MHPNSTHDIYIYQMAIFFLIWQFYRLELIAYDRSVRIGAQETATPQVKIRLYIAVT